MLPERRDGSGILLGMPRFDFILFFIIYSAIGILLSMLFFKLKREKKSKKSKKADDVPDEEVSISTTAV